MASLMDILLRLANVLCGSSAPREEAPVPTTEYGKPLPTVPPILPERPHITPARRPVSVKPLPNVPTTVPERPRIAPIRHQVSVKPSPDFPTIVPERPQVAPQHRREQESKPVPSQPLPAHRPLQRVVSPTPEPDFLLKDQNQVNKDEDYYKSLRAKAIEQGDLMARSFQESHEAYSRGNRALAKELSQKGKQHEHAMERINAEASAWIFKQNNLDSKPGEIDLHGLYVKEAVSYVEKGIQEARQRGDAEIRLIVGKGLHSDGRVAKIKPAIEDLMKKNNIPTETDPRNAGVLIARLC